MSRTCYAHVINGSVGVAVLDIDLSAGLQDIYGLEDFHKAHVVARYRGGPIARFELPVHQGRVSAAAIWVTASRACRHMPNLEQVIAQDVLFGRKFRPPVDLPSCSIVICTRDRPDDLQRCLDSLSGFVNETVEIIVVDNDPPDSATQRVVERYPARYCRQPRRGLNWARTSGVRLARHELVIFVDDDVKVDSRWLDEIRIPFSDEHVGAVTGAIEPLELATPHQYLHEQFGGFYRGFEPRIFHLANWPPAAAGVAGAGASMAIRRHLAIEFGLFEAELDAGTAAMSGGDAYALYRLLRAGYSVVYAPSALAWHRHRKTAEHLEKMLEGYSVGGYCVQLRALFRQGDLDAIVIGLAWFFQHHLTELWRTLRGRTGARPYPLIVAEIMGVLKAPLAYFRCWRREHAMGGLSESSHPLDS